MGEMRDAYKLQKRKLHRDRKLGRLRSIREGNIKTGVKLGWRGEKVSQRMAGIYVVWCSLGSPTDTKQCTPPPSHFFKIRIFAPYKLKS
jgi:hypothetical protein